MATMTIGSEFESMHARSAVRAREHVIAERNRVRFDEQRGRRRGPTPEMFFTKHIDNSRLVKTDDPKRRAEMRRFTWVMGLLFALTMVYVWQHLSSIETGYRVETAKQQVDKLREENRQLRLQEAVASDPNRIDTLAKQLGLDVPAPGQVVRADGTVLAQAQPAMVTAQPASQHMIARLN